MLRHITPKPLLRLILSLSIAASLSAGNSYAAVGLSRNLPELGASSTVMPLAEEFYLGRAWLGAFRQQAQVSTDPIVTDYLEHLMFHLVPYAQMDQYKVLPIIVQSDQLNAFAVPGGVIGVNTGLLLNTKSEDQLAAVLAHELAHITQRHFARSVQNQQQNTMPMLAGMLLGIAAMAAGQADAGIAAITVAQAASLESQLKHSRQHEREADRTGLETMANAGFDPSGAAEMFKIMLDRSRLNSSGYTYLSSHPVTEARIADMRNRAAELVRADVVKPSSDFSYIAAIESAKNFSSSKQAVEYFKSPLALLDEKPRLYGLAQAYIRDNRPSDALPVLEQLLKDDPERIIFAASYGEALLGAGKQQQALEFLREKYLLYPSNYPISFAYAKALESQRQFAKAADILTRLSYRRSYDPEIWYQLAEVSGLAGNIDTLHLARAEYFKLMGQYRNAERQLNFLLEDTSIDNNVRAVAEQRLKEIRVWQKRAQF